MSLNKIFKLGTVFSLSLVSFAMAEEATAGVTSAATHWYAIAAAFGMALASFGGALGQSKALSTALDGIARNPGAQNKIFIPMIIGLALIESLVLLSFVVANSIAGKI